MNLLMVCNRIAMREICVTSDDWSFGGGTVLMRLDRHGLGRDIDIFVPDPQSLGLLTPRLSDAAEVGMAVLRSLSRDHSLSIVGEMLRFVSEDG